VLAHRGRELWIANVGAEDVLELQVRIAPAHRRRVDAPGIEDAGDITRIRCLAAGRMVALALERPAGPEAPRALARDAAGLGRGVWPRGEVRGNAAAEPWNVPGAKPLAAGECRFAPTDGMGAPRPIAPPSAAELYRLLAGQLAIIGREVAFKGRSLDSRRFLRAEEIAPEDHSHW